MEETESFAHAAENALEASNGEDMSSNSMLCQNMSANKQAGITNSGGLCRLRLAENGFSGGTASSGWTTASIRGAAQASCAG